MLLETNRNQRIVQTVQAALQGQDRLAVRAALEELHPSEIADVLESFPQSLREELWVHISADIEGDVLSNVNAGVRSTLMEQMEPDELAAVTRDLESDDVADILQDLPEPIAEAVLRSMDAQNQTRISRVLTYPEDSAGGLMNLDTIAVRSEVEVDVVLRYLRRLGQIPEGTDRLMVVDRENTYLGALALSILVSAHPEQTVGELMHTENDGIPADTPQQEVAILFEQRDLLSAAVVDRDGKLLGRITIDDVVDVIREQADHSFMSAAGLADELDIFAPIIATAKQRTFWLAVNLATAFAAAWVIGQFKASIEQMVALAVLMPVVASMGGVAGSQTLTIVIRGLALGQIGSANSRLILARELAVGFLNGCIWATIVAVIATLWFGNSQLGYIIGAAMIINLLTAAFFGATIPVFLKQVNIDPALAGGVILTTVTDVVGFVAFLGLASLLLL